MLEPRWISCIDPAFFMFLYPLQSWSNWHSLNQYRLAREIASNLFASVCLGYSSYCLDASGRLVAQLSIRTIQKQRPTSQKACTRVSCSVSMCRILQRMAKVCEKQEVPHFFTDRNDGRRKKKIASATAAPGPTLLRSDHIISILPMVGPLCALGRCMSLLAFCAGIHLHCNLQKENPIFVPGGRITQRRIISQLRANVGQGVVQQAVVTKCSGRRKI